MASFPIIVGKVFNIEQGYQNLSNDRGNYSSVACGKQLIGTNHGISAIKLEEYLGACPTVAEMVNLSKKLATEIYKNDFWEPIGGDYLKDNNVALVIFDTNVLRPVWVANLVSDALALQKIYVYAKKPFSLETINAINSADQKRLFNDLKELRKKKHVDAYDSALTSGDTDSTSYKYKDGYLMRCDNLVINASGKMYRNYDIDVLPQEGEVCELLEVQDQSLMGEIAYVQDLKMSWFENNKAWVLVSLTIGMIGLGIYAYRKWRG